MIRGKQELPESWSEAAPGDPESDAELATLMAGVLQPVSPAAGRDRLLRVVSELPLRYAPFVDRVAALWDVSDAQVNAVFAQTKDLAGWKRTPLPSVRIIPVSGGPRTSGAETFMVRFATGARFPRHRHPDHEALFCLEGSYTDSLGRVIQPGDLHEMAPGTEHGLSISKAGPCIAAVVQRGREFTGPLMRLLALVADRDSGRRGGPTR
jgi:quercetin dioxygenase-like cupin family protein